MPLTDSVKLKLDKAMGAAQSGGFNILIIATNKDNEELEVFSNFGDSPDSVARLAVEALRWLSNEEEIQSMESLPPLDGEKRKLPN